MIELRDAHRPSGPPLPPLSPRAELTLLARCLHAEGYDDHVNGHISWEQPDATLLVDPRAIPWSRLASTDIVSIDRNGDLLDGHWSTTPALALHLEIHRRRDDVSVIAHHHSRWGTVWAALGEIPPIYDQQSALLEGGLALHPTYEGSVASAEAASAAADSLGAAGCMLLGHHGVVITGHDPSHVFQRAVLLEWRCRLAWHVHAIRPDAAPMPAEAAAEMEHLYSGRPYPELFAAMGLPHLSSDPAAFQFEKEVTP